MATTIQSLFSTPTLDPKEGTEEQQVEREVRDIEDKLVLCEYVLRCVRS